MKILSILAISVVSAAFGVNQGLAQGLPECASSASDADGDGYGWESGASCVIASGSSTSVVSELSTACVDTDPVGDGWGWDGATSCRVGVSGNQSATTGVAQGLPECASSNDSDGDGYGWENGASCIVGLGSSASVAGQCLDTGVFPWGTDSTTGGFCRLTDQVCVDTDPLNDGWGWNGVTSCQVGAMSTTAGTSCMVVGDTCLDANRVDLGPRPLSHPNNLIRNGNFDEASDNSAPYWTTYIHPGVNSFFSYSQGSNNGFNLGNIRFNFNGSTGSEWWHSQFYSAPVALEGGRTYRLSFDHTKATRAVTHTGSVVVENGSDFTKYLDRQVFRHSAQALRYQVEFYMPVSDDNARVTFNLGDGCPQCRSGGSSWYDNVVLIAID